MKNPLFLKSIIVSSALGFFAANSVQAETLLSESFTTGQRLTQNLTSTSAWYSAFNSAASDSSGDLVVGAGGHVVSYFTDSGSPASLSVGESLTASVTFSLDTPVASTTGFRIGLYNSGGTRISADGGGLSNAAFEGDRGYATFLNLNAASALRIYERDGAGEQLIHSGTPMTSLLGDTGTGTTFTSGADYTLNITLSRTGSGVQMTVAMAGISGYTGTVTDTSDIVTAFDSIVVYGASTAMDGFTLKNVTVSTIPEPSSTTAMVGLLSLLLLGFRRMKQRK